MDGHAGEGNRVHAALRWGELSGCVRGREDSSVAQSEEGEMRQEEGDAFWSQIAHEQQRSLGFIPRGINTCLKVCHRDVTGLIKVLEAWLCPVCGEQTGGGARGDPGDASGRHCDQMDE